MRSNFLGCDRTLRSESLEMVEGVVKSQDAGPEVPGISAEDVRYFKDFTMHR